MRRVFGKDNHGLEWEIVLCASLTLVDVSLKEFQ